MKARNLHYKEPKELKILSLLRLEDFPFSHAINPGPKSRVSIFSFPSLCFSLLASSTITCSPAPKRLSCFPRYQSRPKWRILFFSFPSLRFSFDASSTIFSLSLRRLSFSHCFCPSRAQRWHRSRPLRRAWHRSRTFRRELSRRCLRPRGHFSRSPRSSPTNPRARLEATSATSAGRPFPLPSSTICQGILITNKSWLLPLLLLDCYFS